MKYSEEKVKEICKLLSTGDHIIKDVCKQVGITETTFYEWKESKPQFSESIKKAEDLRLEAFRYMARSGKALLLAGHHTKEETIEYDKDGKVKSKKVVGKFIPPNPTMIIFTETNLDKENFKHTQHIDHTTKGQKVFDYSGMTIEEILKRAKAVKKLEEE